MGSNNGNGELTTEELKHIIVRGAREQIGRAHV